MMQRLFNTVAGVRLTSSTSLAVVTSAGSCQRRHQGTLDHNYLNRGPKYEEQGLGHSAEKMAEQSSLNTYEQWSGYSDSYLAPEAMYYGGAEGYTISAYDTKDTFQHVLELCYNVYGEAADRLQLLHADPLRADFHQVLSEAKVYREQMAKEIDAIYGKAHPTVKTQIDAFAVRRYYFLMDWEQAVENRRKEIVEKISPEFIAEAVRGKAVAEGFKQRLQLLGSFIERTDALPAEIDESQFQPEEVLVLRKKSRYYRNQRKFGSMAGNLDDLHY